MMIVRLDFLDEIFECQRVVWFRFHWKNWDGRDNFYFGKEDFSIWIVIKNIAHCEMCSPSLYFKICLWSNPCDLFLSYKSLLLALHTPWSYYITPIASRSLSSHDGTVINGSTTTSGYISLPYLCSWRCVLVNHLCGRFKNGILEEQMRRGKVQSTTQNSPIVSWTSCLFLCL